MLTILIPLHMYIAIEQLSKWIADGGSQDSYCWSGKLQIGKGKSRTILVVMNYSWKYWYEFMFSLT